MKPAEVRNLTTDEIQTRLNNAREEYMNLRFQMAIGGLTDFTRLRYTRREIARLLTVLNEREQAVD
jgi:large subunit ribosomal protein L29